jgi:hypothetical protein
MWCCDLGSGKRAEAVVTVSEQAEAICTGWAEAA